MSSVSVSISADLQDKICKIAQKSGRTFDDCIALALREYVDNYENFYNSDIYAVDKLERSFFLSVGE